MNDQQKNLRITIYLNLDILQMIKKKLDEKTLGSFRNGPFGHFLDIKMSNVPTQFLNYLIRKDITYK